MFLIILLFSCKEDEDPFIAYDTRYDEIETLTYDAKGIEEANIKTVNGNLSGNPAVDTVILAEILKSCWGKDLEDAKAHINDIEIIQGVSIPAHLFSLEATMPSDVLWDYSATIDIDLPDSVELFMTTTNGNVDINSWNSDAFCSTVNGSMSVLDHQGNLRLLSTNGSIFASTLILDSTMIVELGTSNGDIEINLPPGISATFNTGTTNGLVTIEGFSTVEYQVNTPTQKIGKIGNGGAGIQISTVNGSISIIARSD